MMGTLTDQRLRHAELLLHLHLRPGATDRQQLLPLGRVRAQVEVVVVVPLDLLEDLRVHVERGAHLARVRVRVRLRLRLRLRVRVRVRV